MTHLCRRPPTSRSAWPSARARHLLFTGLSALLLQGAWVATAWAEATVVVELKSTDGSAAEGTVQLTQGETRLRCTTSQSRCELKNVPGGMYTVSLEQGGQPSGKPKTVMIPPQGEVKLIVAAK